jgi:uncharacterized membrane protein YidH (DUF202 family)
MTRAQALIRTGLAFGGVGLAWLVLASFLPNFHLANTSSSARILFVGVVLVLLALILAAQLAMLRSWFHSLQVQRPDQVVQVGRLRVAVWALVALGVVLGVAVLGYATLQWMPKVQEAVRGQDVERTH